MSLEQRVSFEAEGQQPGASETENDFGSDSFEFEDPPSNNFRFERDQVANPLLKQMAVKPIGWDRRPAVLIVDDTEYNIIPVERMLQTKFGIVVETAANGQITIDMFKQKLAKPCGCALRCYRLILMDLSISVVSGEEATAEMLRLISGNNAAVAH